MSITLALNGSLAPTTYQVGGAFELTVLMDGATPLFAEWDYGLRNGPRQASGVTSTFLFAPTHCEPYYIHVQATGANGISEEAIFPVTVTPTGNSPSTVTVQWSDPKPLTAGLNSATINVSGVTPPKSVAWAHYYNGIQFEAGSGMSVPTRLLNPGVHRLVVTVIDPAGYTVVAESTLHIPGSFGLQSAIVPPQPVNSSLIYLGSVYSPILEGHKSIATSLPFPVASFESSVKLIPGSTHFVPELDPLYNTVDDEVVVRTQLGNWTLKGPPSGLTAETLPYDYQHGLPFQPAPLDLSAHYGVDVWNAHNVQVSAFKFRVRFRCFVSGEAVYRYTPCEWSSYSGGTGERQRRLIALPTKLDLSLDDETPQNRGNSQNVETFTIPNAGFIIGNMETSGLPDRPTHVEDHFYTDQNTIAIYESDNGLADVLAHCTYGMPDVRPCILDFSTPASPRIVNKPKRLWDKLVLYMAGGAFNSGTVVTVKIYTGRAPGYVEVPITLTTNVYNPAYSGFVKAGEASLDVEDFEFDRLGVRMEFQIDESHAGTVAPPYDQMMSVGEDFYYTRLNSPAIRIDTACFRNPELMTTFEGTFLGSAVPIPSCDILTCGPIGTYCYVETSGTGTYMALQPLGFPAPFIAPVNDEAHCYGAPTFMAEYFGGPTQANAVVGYSGTTGCGQAYQYIPCDSNMPSQLGVVFPKNTSPHPAVVYGGECYTLLGAIKQKGALTWLSASDVAPVTGCLDTACTGSNPAGGSVDYIDQETLQTVTVAFPHTDTGLAYWGAVPEARSQGYGATPPGSVKWYLWDNPVVPVLTATEATDLDFTVTPSNIWREIVVTHAGQRFHYRLYPGLAKATITVQTSDVVTLEFGNRLRQYRGLSGEVTWLKHVAVPYLYDTGTVAFSPTTGTLAALGFCGLDSRQDYSFFGTLNGSPILMDAPNPDCVVTVKDNSSLPEMVVLRTKQPHEVNFQFDLPSYQAQRLRSPLVFKFYAGRNRTGAHGEMDVWMSRVGAPFNPSFPQYFKVSPFKSLVISDNPFRKTTQQSDTTRRSLRLTDGTTAMDLTSPRIHVDDRGNRIPVMTEELNDYVFTPGNPNPYTFTSVYDTGISEKVYWNLESAGGPQLQALYSVPAKPRGICYVASQDEVWVACPDSNLLVILAGDGTGIKQFVTVAAGRPYGLDYAADTDTVVVFCQTDGSVNIFDAATRNLQSHILTGLGQFYPFIWSLAAYNPACKCIHIAGVPYSSFDMTIVEVDPSNGNVVVFPLGIGAVSLASVLYNPSTLETIVACESGGSFAFNVYTDTVENLGIPISTVQGACIAPEIDRIIFTSAANPPGDRTYFYDPRSRKIAKVYPYSNPVRGTGWHPKRRKIYMSTLSLYFGGPGVGIVDIHGNLLATVPNYDWGFQWVYSPLSRLMVNSIPQSFYFGNYVAFYT